MLESAHRVVLLEFTVLEPDLCLQSPKEQCVGLLGTQRYRYWGEFAPTERGIHSGMEGAEEKVCDSDSDLQGGWKETRHRAQVTQPPLLAGQGAVPQPVPCEAEDFP